MSQSINPLSSSAAANGRAADSDHVQAFVSILAEQYFFDGPDRRSEPRLRITLPAELEPLDENRQGLNYRIRAVTRDISSSGIGLVCQDPIGARHIKLFLVSPCGAALTQIVEINRCEPVGYYYNVGGKFVSRETD